HQRRRAGDDVEQLLLVTLGLVVLGDRLSRWDLDQVHAERPAAERATHEPPVARSLELVPVSDHVAVVLLHSCLLPAAIVYLLVGRSQVTEKADAFRSAAGKLLAELSP